MDWPQHHEVYDISMELPLLVKFRCLVLGLVDIDPSGSSAITP